MKKVWITLALCALCGCSTTYWRNDADKEVGRILTRKNADVKSEPVPPYARTSDSTAPETVFLTLKDALITAAKNNRTYQTTKENVYLAALNLTYQRYLYRPRFTIGGDVGWNKNGGESVYGDVDFGLIYWLANGAQLTAGFTQSFFKYLTGDKSKSVSNVVSLNLLQPFFQGAGRDIALEDLVQAERDVVYQIRSFLRYQRSFSVDVAGEYFTVLLAKNTRENYWDNYVFLKNTRERIEMLAQAGRIATFQADQASQNEYSGYQSWVAAVNDYNQLLDNFKINLGLAPAVPLVLDEKGLESFFTRGVPPVKFNASEYVQKALEARLDLMNTYDAIDDAVRQAKVAANNLRTQLNLNLGFDNTGAYAAGLTFNLPTDMIPERNAYRSALISLDRAKRQFDQAKDQVKLDVINSGRDLEETYQSYLIQKISLDLASKRVESTGLLLQAGRADTRDLLDSQSSYLSARNALSSAIVKYLNDTLDFLQSAEMLDLDDQGVWKGDLYEKISGETP